MQFVITGFLLITTFFPAYADGTHPRGINLDGSLGTAGKLNLPGPDYDIKAEYGRQAGTNLFHSFEQFNIHSKESATFTGPDSVQNIITRVTGGEASWIDGRLASAIPNADLYFLNPAGVMFGPDASLDLGGSFHVSTADYLRLGDNEKFYTNPLESDVLSVAAPAAFGFLDNDISPITFEGKGEIPSETWDREAAGLAVAEGKGISVVGGDIEIKNSTCARIMKPVPLSENLEFPWVSPLGSLSAAGGNIRMVSMSSPGEVGIGNEQQELGDAAGGNIRLSDKSLLDVSGTGAGNIFIRSGQFVAESSNIYARTFGDRNGGGIDIQADNISFTGGSEINSNTYGSGKGGDITLNASESITFSGADDENYASKIFLETYGGSEDSGDAGNLDIKANDDILFSDGASVMSLTFGGGDCGRLRFRAGHDICFQGISKDPFNNYLLRNYIGDNPVNPEAASGGVFSNVIFGEGNGSDIEMEADNILLSDSAAINSTTYGSGNSGDIRINAAGTVTIRETIGPANWAIGIFTQTISPGDDAVSGDGGDIFLEANELIIEDGCFIMSGSTARSGKSGKSGDISIQVAGEVRLSGINPYGDFYPAGSYIGTECTGNGDTGDIFLEAHTLVLEDGGDIQAGTYGSAPGGNIQIQADTVDIRGSSPVKLFNDKTNLDQYTMQDAVSGIKADALNGTGDSGTICVKARHINLSDSGTISTSTAVSGKAGDITLNVSTLELENEALVSSSSLSPENGGASGTITLNTDSLRLSGESKITTEAVCTASGQATDGRITVNAGDMLYLNNSQITTSVRGGDGNGGDIEIRKPETITLNHSKIRANAYEGNGGNIHITGEQFIRSSDSMVEASSEKGIDGNVNIEFLKTGLDSALTILPETFPDAARWIKTPCTGRSGENVSHFVMKGRDAMPTALDDWLASPLPDRQKLRTCPGSDQEEGDSELSDGKKSNRE
ncbi:filamentous hemagglutinin N-terminal domain-containing protein [Desulfonema magnum]|uniref:Filamentous hemagglutinin family N-terminal domain-containing protein n=1 Tax=Desulfonema magnum TaxID=45655 RepID=A0A975GS12_9BACT|nr:filamentous hemagglutinin N-terminal domain-containing protein [Desulfonema magnum]QTA91437.1 Filamentous hemagglutinin family N-terminal domain-containing protein [Desulfonema magnum]